jgi:hypothetical protein
MKTIRNLAAGLLLFTGVLHLISVTLVKFDPTSVITIFFGLAYLVIGIFLFRGGRTILWLGAIVPLVGMLLAIIGMLMQVTLLGITFIIIDVVIIACCFYLIFRKE